MRPKYEFTGETMNYDGHVLHRIRRLSDGKIGGWIESEENLSQEGNCWVNDDAKVYDNARVSGNALVYDDAIVVDNANVCDNAKVSGWAAVGDEAKVFGRSTVCDDAQVYSKARVYGNAKVYSRAEVHGNAHVCEDAQVHGNARVHDNAQVYGNARVHDNAQIYGDARVDASVYGNARVHGNAKVFGNAKVYGYADVYDNAEVFGIARVYGKACVYGDAKVDYEISSSTVGAASTNESIDENTEVLKDFIYKIDDSSKLDVQLNYDSMDAFFEDTSDESYVEHKCLTIVAVDTKVPILKLEKTQVKDQNMFKFIVDITNDDGDNYSVKSIIDSKDKFEQLLKSTIDSLKNYTQFSKYADDLENCV